MIGLNNR